MSTSDLSVIHSDRTILHPTSLTIEPSSRIGVVGASGSGKSTFGNALIDDLQNQGFRIAQVPQSPDEALDPLRKMSFHWREAERAYGLAHDAVQQQTLFSALKIEHGDLRKRPWAWSRGMQQRFVIAMALIGSPDLLVMDEPTSALDPIVAASTVKLLEEYLENQDTSVILITHDLGLVARRVNRLLVIDKGRIVEDRDAKDVLNSPQSQSAKLLCANRSWISASC